MATYYNTIIDDSPICYWRFGNDSLNKGSKGPTHFRAYPNHNQIAFSFVDPDDPCWQFNGNNSSVQCEEAYPETGQYYEASLELWFKPDKSMLTSGKMYTLLSKAGWDGSSNDLVIDYLLFVHNNRLRFYNSAKMRETTLTSSYDLKADTWYHVVVTVSKSAHRLYINGALNVSKSGLTDGRLEHQAGNRFFLAGIQANTNKESLYNKASWRPYKGFIDEVAMYDYVLDSSAVQQHFVAGFGGNFSALLNENNNINIAYRVRRYDVEFSNTEVHYDPCGVLDRSSLFVTSGKEYTYDQYINKVLKPEHYYKLSEPPHLPTSLCQDYGFSTTYKKNGTHYDATANSNVAGALKQGIPNNTAKYFRGDFIGYTRFTDSRPFSMTGTHSEMSIMFWYKSVSGNSDQHDGLLGYDHNHTSGFCVMIRDSRVVFRKMDGSLAFELLDPIARQHEDQWNHYAFVITRTGRILMYVNGTFADSIATNGRGIKVPTGTNSFYLGSVPNTEDKPGFHLDELIVVPRELTSNQIRDYNTAAVTNNVAPFVTDGADISNPAVRKRTKQLTTLSNVADITKYVTSYNLNRDMHNLIDEGTMQVAEAWGSSNLNSQLRTNSYVLIEERYTDADFKIDSGWLPVGHYLVDGPAGTNIAADGSKTLNIVLKGIMNLSTFDLCQRSIEPDTVTVYKSPLELRGQTLETYRFSSRRAGSRDNDDEDVKWYRNWADNPRVRIWVSELRKFTDNGNRKDLDALGPEDEIRIKSGSGNIQVLFGEGTIVIDRQYFEDAIADNGIGNPNYAEGGVKAEFDRFLTNEDIVNTQVTKIYNDSTGASYIEFEDEVFEGDGKTIIIKSGGAKGRFYKIWSIDN